MSKVLSIRFKEVLFIQFCVFIAVAFASAQSSKVMGEVRFEGATKVEKDSGVWIDRDYVGFLKELHGETEVNLLPGQKSEVKTELVKGSIQQASPEIKQPQ